MGHNVNCRGPSQLIQKPNIKFTDAATTSMKDTSPKSLIFPIENQSQDPASVQDQNRATFPHSKFQPHNPLGKKHNHIAFRVENNPKKEEFLPLEANPLSHRQTLLLGPTNSDCWNAIDWRKKPSVSFLFSFFLSFLSFFYLFLFSSLELISSPHPHLSLTLHNLTHGYSQAVCHSHGMCYMPHMPCVLPCVIVTPLNQAKCHL